MNKAGKIETKLLKEDYYSSAQEFEDAITLLLGKGFEIEAFNTVSVNNYRNESVLLMIKRENQKKKVQI